MSRNTRRRNALVIAVRVDRPAKDKVLGLSPRSPDGRRPGRRKASASATLACSAMGIRLTGVPDMRHHEIRMNHISFFGATP